MRYKITIERIEEKEVSKSVYEQVAATGNKRDGGPVYDYVNTTEEIKVRTEVLSQEVDQIDLTKVIKAINNIE